MRTDNKLPVKREWLHQGNRISPGGNGGGAGLSPSFLLTSPDFFGKNNFVDSMSD
jgi:hypothetical protein